MLKKSLVVAFLAVVMATGSFVEYRVAFARGVCATANVGANEYGQGVGCVAVIATDVALR